MTSDEGLNAYGAVTWGQFFIYQGFNDRAGWMHTSSGVDDIDEYLETVVEEGRRALLPATATKSGPVTTSDDHRALQDGERHGREASSPSTARTTARSCARPTASG